MSCVCEAGCLEGWRTVGVEGGRIGWTVGSTLLGRNVHKLRSKEGLGLVRFRRRYYTFEEGG